MSEQVEERSAEHGGRYQRSTSGLLGALVVLLAAVLAVVGFRALIGDEPSSPVRAVDYEQDAVFASEAAKFDLVAPRSLPEGWRATTVRFNPALQSWHIGLLTGEDKYVGLEQASESVDSMVETYVDQNASKGDPVEVAGQSWSTYTDSGGDLALVRKDTDTTTLVVGSDVAQAELVAFVESLRPPRGAG